MLRFIVTGLDLGGIHARYEGVLRIMNQRKCCQGYGEIWSGQKYAKRFHRHLRVSTERERCGKPSVKDIELRCRVALSDYQAQSKRFKEEGRLLPFFPAKSFYTGK